VLQLLRARSGVGVERESQRESGGNGGHGH
jgi:hypothetical protein